MNWVEIDLDHEPYSGPSDVFARSRSSFSVNSLGKQTAAVNQDRQQYFHAQLRRLATALGTRALPVFVDFRGKRLRMDKGCVGHAVAAGILERPEDNAEGFVDQVRMRDATA